MSLYGPKIRLPKVDIPIASGGGASWNLEKEKKIAIYAIIAIVVIAILWLAVPVIFTFLTSGLDSMLNPAVTINWRNNPLNITNGVREAELDLTLTNTSKEEQTEVSFNITTNSNEIIIFCPNSLYDTNKGRYVLENIAPGDKRKIPCIIRRNPDASVFSGSYTLDVITSLGNVKTNLEIISK
ncbi:MAG: hypothetical protein WCW44_01640 [archaeon]|jgi:hypothetical protein